jgi:hypothetical protein
MVIWSIKKNQRYANSAQAQPEKGMRLCAARYVQV